MRWIALALILLPLRAEAQCAVQGSLNPSVTQANIASTICIKGWTKTIRPAQSFTRPLKRSLLPKGAHAADYELDHCIPLGLGGAPKAHDNLWLQPWNGPCGAYAKDVLERYLQREVCLDRMPLLEAQFRVMQWCPL